MKIFWSHIKRNSLLLVWLFFICSSCFDSNEVDFDKQLREDLAAIDQYLLDHNITALTDSTKQIRFVIHQLTAGEIPTLDSCITATFFGKFLDTDDTFTEGEGYSFPLRGDLIQGWKLAIPLLHQGDEATFYIPSILAYGPSGIPDENIPPNANVYFHFKLLSVGKKYGQSPSPFGSCD